MLGEKPCFSPLRFMAGVADFGLGGGGLIQYLVPRCMGGMAGRADDTIGFMLTTIPMHAKSSLMTGHASAVQLFR